jgi:hypothetical protein
LAGLFDLKRELEVKIYNVIILIFVFYRGLSFLRIFDVFTSLVGMIIIILKRLMIFFLLLIYMYLCSSVLLIKLIGNVDIIKTLGDVYYWIILGSIEDYAFDVSYAAIPIVLGSLFVTIILLNILIAYLSNLFSRLEEQQRVQEMKERAGLILDIEVFVMFFKYGITGKNKLRNEFEMEKYRRMLKGKDQSSGVNMQTKRKTKILKHYLSKEKYLYIFKKINLAKDLSEENIYQRIKTLEKSIWDLNSLVSKRSRSHEAQIEEVFQMVRSNNTSQEKTVDDLKKVMGSNSKNVYENTESMLIKIEAQQKKIEVYLKKIEAVEKQIGENNNMIQAVVNKVK